VRLRVLKQELTVIVASLELTDGHTPLFRTAWYFVVVVKFTAVRVVVVFVISTGVTQLSVDDCHLVTVPVCPDNVNVVLLVPEQTVALPATVPPTDTGLTVIVVSVEFAEEHTPLVITARYLVDIVKLVAVRVFEVFAISTGVTQLSVDDCHLVIVPVWPDNVSVVLLVPEQTVALPAMVPPTDTRLTVIVASVEFIEEHTPLVTTARYFVAIVKLTAVRVVVVFVISTGVTQLSVDDCHLVTVPVCPDNVSVVLLVPEQTVALPATVPPTDIGLTVTVTSVEFEDEHTPLVTTARYFVVVVKLVAVRVVVVFAISTGVTQLSIDDCHLVTVPVCPDNVNLVLLVPEQTVALPATEPPTDTDETVIVASVEFAEEHTPLITTARYLVAIVKLVAVSVVVVFVISTGVTQLSVDDCHLVTVPV